MLRNLVVRRDSEKRNIAGPLIMRIRLWELSCASRSLRIPFWQIPLNPKPLNPYIRSKLALNNENKALGVVLCKKKSKDTFLADTPKP